LDRSLSRSKTTILTIAVAEITLFGAKLSEHGKANALDVRAIKLASGTVEVLTDASAPVKFRLPLRRSSCARFTTVLGPGADNHHENHVHVDLAERRNAYRLCQWDLRTPDDPVEVVNTEVPLPRMRPKYASAHTEPVRAAKTEPLMAHAVSNSAKSVPTTTLRNASKLGAQMRALE
jgi:hypothetical protein